MQNKFAFPVERGVWDVGWEVIWICCVVSLVELPAVYKNG
jgi:hypothetical protein